jgi:hypothetical protein
LEFDQAAAPDDAADQAEEGLVDVVADLTADAQSAEALQQREALFDDPPMYAQP